MGNPPLFLVAALSGRALAAAARRAERGALVLDLFGDVDTRAHATASLMVRGSVARGFDPAALLEAAERLAPVGRGVEQGLVYGAGFEAQPALLADLGRGRRLFGNPPETLARVKDPAAFFGLLDRLGLPYPEISLERPDDAADWLCKRVGASGGGHVRAAILNNGEPGDRYYQRRIDGQTLSALFLADGRAARLLGFSEQWVSPGEAEPYRFGGAVRPARVGPTLARDLAAAVDGLVREIGLVGLNSLDVIASDDGFAILEVNPRPGATLDIFDGTDPETALFTLHLAACEGKLPRQWGAPHRSPPEAKATAIVYADRRLTVPADFSWPEGTVDRPEAGTIIERDEPVCTVLSRADGPEAARARAAAQGAAVLSALHAEPVVAAQAG
ncbi:ATP-grasp domain-containing protein [Rhodospirillaceae bacterium SYSU D60014]|uniref:ATP-grasp domain-containing protein n=1 Tax=Virgifigura deserti TaxID=2268457 RepID=UPI000E671B78